MFKSRKNVNLLIRFSFLFFFLVFISVSGFADAVVKSVSIKGNRELKTSRLRSILRVREGKPFYDYFLLMDVDALRRFYHKEGFPDVSVDANFKYKNNSYYVVYKIKEGKFQVVSAVHYNDNDFHFDKVVKDFIGKRASKDVEDTIRIEITDFLMNHGYYKPKITIKKTTKDKYKIELYVAIEKGKLYRFGDIYLIGLKKIKKEYVLREITFKKGELFSKKKIKETQAELYKLAVFSDISVSLYSKNDSVVVVFNFIEDKFKWVGFDFGYTSPLIFRLGIEWGNNNFFNKLIHLSVKNSNEFDFENGYYNVGLNFKYEKRRIFGYKLLNNFILSYEKVKDEFAESSKINFSFIVKKEIFKNFYIIPGYERELSYYFNFQKEQEGVGENKWLSANSLVMTAVYDNLKNKLNPIENAFSFRVFQKVSGGFLSGDWQYYYKDLDCALYRSLYEKIFMAVFHVNFKQYNSFDGERKIFFDDLLYLGGPYTIRGYDNKEIGDNFITTLVVNNELRWKIYGNFWGELFLDTGYGLLENEPFNLNKFKYGYGMGLRYVLPFIIIRMDLAQRYEDRAVKLHFAVGQFF